MDESSTRPSPRRGRTRVVAACVAAAVAVPVAWFVATHASAAAASWRGVASADPLLLAAGVLCSLLAIVNRGMMNHAAHQAVGLDAGVAEMTRTAAVGFSAQKVVKSAGVIGLAVFVRHGARRGHAPGSVAAACALTAAASFGALGVLLAATIVVLAATGSLTSWWIVAAAAFAVYALAVGVAAFAAVRSRGLARRLWAAGQRAAVRTPLVRRRCSGTAPFPDELFDAIEDARSRPGATRRMVGHAVASKCLGAGMLGTAAAAAGLSVTLATALVIYATALAASIVSIVPSGVGTVEASTASLLVASGATVGSAALAVALFRLLDTGVPLLAGAVLSRRDLRPPEPRA